MKIHFVILSLAFILSVSCEYKLDSSYYTEIDTTNLSSKLFIELWHNEPDLTLEYVTMMHYKIRSYDLHIYNVRAFLNGYEIFESEKAIDSFLLSPYSMGQGYMELELAVITESKTNSLAELTGHEGLIFRRTFKFYTPGNSHEFKITKVSNDNGLLKLQWDTSQIPVFRSYLVYVSAGYLEYPQNIAMITNRNQTSCFDRAYIGGSADYSVTAMGEYESIGSEMYHVDFPYPKIDTLWSDESKVLFCWNSSPFHQVVNGYYLDLYNNTFSAYPIFRTSNINDTTYLLETKNISDQSEYKLHVSTNTSYLPFSDESLLNSSILLNRNPNYAPF